MNKNINDNEEKHPAAVDSHLLALKGEVVCSKRWRGERLTENRECGRVQGKCGARRRPGMPDWQSRTALNK